MLDKLWTTSFISAFKKKLPEHKDGHVLLRWEGGKQEEWG